jgi:hypothetical protein
MQKGTNSNYRYGLFINTVKKMQIGQYITIFMIKCHWYCLCSLKKALVVAVAVEDLVASAALVASAEDSVRRKTSVDQWNRLESSSSAKNTTVL